MMLIPLGYICGNHGRCGTGHPCAQEGTRNRSDRPIGAIGGVRVPNAASRLGVHAQAQVIDEMAVLGEFGLLTFDYGGAARSRYRCPFQQRDSTR
jgi:hypothetical protein